MECPSNELDDGVLIGDVRGDGLDGHARSGDVIVGAVDPEFGEVILDEPALPRTLERRVYTVEYVLN